MLRRELLLPLIRAPAAIAHRSHLLLDDDKVVTMEVTVEVPVDFPWRRYSSSLRHCTSPMSSELCSITPLAMAVQRSTIRLAFSPL
ncbi:hypothetical protein NL676_018284 [Syzygium grande]|nr:hypothetical protein NL676_018284 [Syzygium grande]